MDQVKTCTRCGVSKPLSDFPSHKTKGTLSICRTCKQEYEREYARNFTEEQRLARNRNHRRRVNQCREYVAEYLRQHPCVDCGETDIIVLDFDHVRDKKIMPVSHMVRGGQAIETIAKEIAKCEVRCANCHRRVTHKRRQEDNSQIRA